MGGMEIQMIKNDINDTLANELLISIDGLLKDKENFANNMELLYKKYLGFPPSFLAKLPQSELEKFFVHNRIKDYSKICALAILFIEEWFHRSEKDGDAFSKLIKGYELLSDVYLNERYNQINYYKEYLIKCCNELTVYEVDTNIKKSIIKVCLKEKYISKVDDLIFEVLREDLSYLEEAISIYENIVQLEDYDFIGKA